MNRSTVEFLVKTLGADEAAREFGKIERAAQKAGMTVKKYLSTNAGEAKLVEAQARGAAARVEQQAAAENKKADAVSRSAAATDRAGRSQAGYFAHIAKTTVQSALINQLFLQFVDVAGQAIQQVDLMQNFPATMASMGQSTAEAGQAMDTLRNYIGQVGGNLGDATSYVTRFTGAIGNVKAATAVFVGLNNALIAGDSSLEEQKQAAIQFAQSLERGKPDLREWRTLTQNMSFQLGMVAKSMGYVNANELGEALSQGKESMAAFTTALTKMSTGTGPIAEQAMARMSGMQFSFNVMKNTMVQGLAAIINTIGRQNIVSFFQFLTQVIQVLTQVVITLIGALVTLLNFLGSIFGLPAIKLKKDVEGVADGIGAGAGAAEDLADGMKGAGDEAKKLNKSLASFDKMNVLPDKESSSGGKDAGGAGGAGFDTGQMGELGDLFGDINGKLQEASIWAKIFAGVLVALAANAIIKKFFKMLNDGPLGWVLKFAKNLLKGVGEFLVAWGKAVVEVVAKWTKAMAEIVAKWAKAAADAVVHAAKAAAEWVEGAAKAAKAWVTKMADIVKEWVKTVAKAAIHAAKVAFEWVISAAKAAAAWVAKMAVIVAEWVATAAKAVVHAVASGAAWVASAAASAIAWLAQTALIVAYMIGVGIGAIANALIASAAWVASAAATAAAWVIANAAILGLWGLIILAIVAAVAFIITHWNDITKFFGDVFNGILDIFKGIGEWFSDLFNGAVEGIKNIWNGIPGFFTGIWEGIKSAFSAVGTWLSNTFKGAWEGVKNVFNAGGNIFNGIKDGISGVFKTVVNGLIGGINTVIAVPFNAINGALKTIKNIDIMGNKPFNFIPTIPTPQIPMLATGGVITQPTMAMVGEAGAEAVMPLENNTEWIDKLASKINTNTSSSNDMIPVTNKRDGQPTNITINVSGVFATSTQEQKKVADLIAKQLNSTLRAQGLKGAY